MTDPHHFGAFAPDGPMNSDSSRGRLSNQGNRGGVSDEKKSLGVIQEVSV